MARVAVTVTTLTPGTAVANAAGTTADPTEDHVLTPPTGACLEEISIRFANTNGSDRVATIVAGDTPPALSSGQGNLDITVPATSGVMWVQGLESARFLQSDGTLNIDLEGQPVDFTLSRYAAGRVQIVVEG
jgi:hypothetical protein